MGSVRRTEHVNGGRVGRGTYLPQLDAHVLEIWEDVEIGNVLELWVVDQRSAPLALVVGVLDFLSTKRRHKKEMSDRGL